MPTHTQLKNLYRTLLLFLTTLILLAQMTTAGQSASPAIGAVSQDTRVSLQAKHPLLPGASDTQHVPVDAMQVKRQAAVPNPGSLTFLPAVSYYSGGYLAMSVAVADVNGDG